MKCQASRKIEKITKFWIFTRMEKNSSSVTAWLWLRTAAEAPRYASSMSPTSHSLKAFSRIRRRALDMIRVTQRGANVEQLRRIGYVGTTDRKNFLRLQLVVDSLRDGERTLIQYRAQHAHLGAFQFPYRFAGGFTARGICLNHHHYTLGGTSQDHAVVDRAQRGPVDQNIVKLRSQFRHARPHAIRAD